MFRLEACRFHSIQTNVASVVFMPYHNILVTWWWWFKSVFKTFLSWLKNVLDVFPITIHRPSGCFSNNRVYMLQWEITVIIKDKTDKLDMSKLLSFDKGWNTNLQQTVHVKGKNRQTIKENIQAVCQQIAPLWNRYVSKRQNTHMYLPQSVCFVLNPVIFCPSVRSQTTACTVQKTGGVNQAEASAASTSQTNAEERVLQRYCIHSRQLKTHLWLFRTECLILNWVPHSELSIYLLNYHHPPWGWGTHASVPLWKTPWSALAGSNFAMWEDGVLCYE